MTVNHKDTNKSNNDISNLEWVTQEENNRHRDEYYKTHKTHTGKTRLTDEQVGIILDEMDKGTPYSKILNIIGVENTPVNRGTLTDIKRGKAYVYYASNH